MAFQIDSICTHKTDESILEALHNLPKDLPETFDRILLNLKQSGSDLALSRKIFEIVAIAHRPLDLAELREAISVETGSKVWDDKKLVNDIHRCLDCCSSLIVVDEEYSTVHYAHHSVKQYLFSPVTNPGVKEYHIEPHEADRNLGEIILTYLGLDIFDMQLTKTSSESQTETPFSPSHILQATLPKTRLVNAMALKYLKSREKDRLDVRRQLEMTAGISEKGIRERYFLSYSKEFWLFHTKMLEGSPDKYHPVWERLLSGRSDITGLPWAPEHWLDLNSKFVKWVMQNRHQLLFRCVFYEISKEESTEWRELGGMVYLLERSAAIGLTPDTEAEIATYGLQVWTSREVEAQRTEQQTPLPAKDGIHLLQVLLKKRADVSIRGIKHETALFAAVASSNEEAVRLLLENKADANMLDRNGDPALQEALLNDNATIIRPLIEYGADVNARCRQRGIGVKPMYEEGETNGTVLHLAVTKGDERVVQLLLEKGANVNAQGGRYGNSLQAAIQNQHENVVRILLEKGADINAQSGRSGTALRIAALYANNEGIVQLLLEKGADLRIQSGIYGTLLEEIVSISDRRIIRLLLEKGADEFEKDEQNKFVLSEAAISDDINAVKHLIGKGANINVYSDEYGTALQAAAKHGREKAIRLLLEEGADVNVEGICGTALQVAARQGYEKVIRLLLEKGANINFEGKRHGTVLRAAAKYKYTYTERVIRLLIEKGANVNAQSKKYGTALHAAASSGVEATAWLLLENGADVNVQHEEHGTALHLAVARRDDHDGECEKIVRLLLEYGADINVIDGEYRTALEVAVNEEVVRLLLDYMVIWV